MAKRRLLPAWIREGLEKMERDKQKKRDLEAKKKAQEEKRALEEKKAKEREDEGGLRSKFVSITFLLQ